MTHHHRANGRVGGKIRSRVFFFTEGAAIGAGFIRNSRAIGAGLRLQIAPEKRTTKLAWIRGC